MLGHSEHGVCAFLEPVTSKYVPQLARVEWHLL